MKTGTFLNNFIGQIIYQETYESNITYLTSIPTLSRLQRNKYYQMSFTEGNGVIKPGSQVAPAALHRAYSNYSHIVYLVLPFPNDIVSDQ